MVPNGTIKPKVFSEQHDKDWNLGKYKAVLSNHFFGLPSTTDMLISLIKLVNPECFNTVHYLIPYQAT